MYDQAKSMERMFFCELMAKALVVQRSKFLFGENSPGIPKSIRINISEKIKRMVRQESSVSACLARRTRI